MFSKAAIWVVIAMVLFMVFRQFDGKNLNSGGTNVAYSDFLDEIKAKQLKEVTIEDRNITAVTLDGNKIKTTGTYLDRGLIGDLVNNGVKFDVKQAEEPSLLVQLLMSWGPMLVFIGIWIFFMRQMQGGGKGGAFSFGKSKARMLDETNNNVNFADVAGCDEAKEEVQEIVEFLRYPTKFQKLGGRIPRGVLMVGPPGTGKTLLARACAAQTKSAFLKLAGPQLVQMFIGK